MKVKMYKDAKGSPNGIEVVEYKKNETYDMPDALASVFIREGLAIEVKSIEKVDIENKAIEVEERKVVKKSKRTKKKAEKED